MIVYLAAIGTGLGIWLLIIGAFPRPPRLDKALAALSAAPIAEPDDNATDEGWTGRLGRPLVKFLLRAGLPTASTRRDLAAIGKPVDVHLAEQGTAGLIGLLAPTVVTVLVTLAGIDPGVMLPVGGGLVLGLVLFLAPEIAVRSEAKKLRASFRHALGAFLDLTEISMAGGSGVDQALDDAASVGHGVAFTEIRYALSEARLARIAPWDTLSALGQRVGVAELEQLAATVGLAGTEGARVRASLESRAQALRAKQLTDAEAEAASVTERMSLPVGLFLTGFLIFITYPALARVLGGF